MSKDDSDKAVMAGEIGTFLIRFSTTYAQQGQFVVVLKTTNGPEHHVIEVIHLLIYLIFITRSTKI